MSIKLKLAGLDATLEKAVGEIESMLGINLAEDGLPVSCEKGDRQEYSFDGREGRIIYNRSHGFLRGLGVFTEKLAGKVPFCITENAAYESLGIMVDCSRNGVLNMQAFKKLIKHLALMGYSNVQLYTEDTYEIEGYPYFGYQRGRYTKKEFQEMDLYAGLFSIELVPCIQTLAHLGRIFKWPAFSEVRDCNDILLIDEEKTYTLLDAMFRTMSENLTSRRINIGMDEAHMVGLGKFLDRHGYQDRMEIMLRHFNRVMEIARKYGYKPMMWSDMLFRLVSGGEYYTEDCPVREDLLKLIPEDITLVYWDYYSTEQKTYDIMLRNHLKISSKLAFAGGAWKWSGFCPNSHFSEYVASVAHKSCLENGVGEVLITSWGDNGAECPLFSVLPALQIWAELCYANNSRGEYLEQRFFTCTGASYEDFMVLGRPALTPDNPAPGRCGINASKYLLYQDVLGGLYDAHVLKDSFREHFAGCTRLMEQCLERSSGEWKYLFETQRTFCHVLELKCDMGLRLRQAYASGDKETIAAIAGKELPELLVRIEKLLKALGDQWKKENKIFGFDVLELRFGGLKQRLLSVKDRLTAYVNHETALLEELEYEALTVDGKTHTDDNLSVWCPNWDSVASASVIAE